MSLPETAGDCAGALPRRPPSDGQGSPRRGRPGFARRGLLMALALGLAGGVLFWCYLRISETQPVPSDGASNALQAWDMLHGNLLLHGWTVTDVSFYTTELPEYMIVEAIRGLGAFDLHDAAAATYTLLVLLAGYTARGRATGRDGLFRFAIAAGIMIAPQLGHGAFLLLLSPDHIGTEVPLLLIWVLLDRGPRRGWVAVLAGLLLTWVTVGDRIATLVAALPIAACCAYRLHRDRLDRDRLDRDRLDRDSRRWADVARARPFELWLGISALASIPAAWLASKLISLLHGFAPEPLAVGISAPTAWWSHLVLTTEGILGLYGAYFAGHGFGAFVLAALAHLGGVILAAWAFWLGCRVLRRGDDLVTGCLTVAVAVNLIVFTFSDMPHTFWDVREIAPVLPYGAVLAGRLLAPRLRSPAVRPLLAALGACYLLALAYAVAHPAHPYRSGELASWLTAHHLTCGLGSYATGNDTTLISGGQVSLRAPTWTANGVYQGRYESSVSWFSPTACDATFVVDTRRSGVAFYIPPHWVFAAFGKPTRTIRWDKYTIWTWDKNLMRMLRPASQHLPPVGGYVQYR